MLKLLRNHLLDKGFTLTSKGSSVNLTKGDFEQLLLLDGNELKLVPKLSNSHVDVKGREDSEFVQKHSYYQIL